MHSRTRVGKHARRVACVTALLAVSAACGSSKSTSTPTTGGTQTTVAGATTVGGETTTSAAAASTTAAPKPYNVTIAFPGDAPSLDPQKIQDVPARTFFANIFEPLVRFSDDGKSVVPVLAAAVPTKIDDTTWEIKLKTEPVFSSGKKFSSEDVVYTYERLLDPKFDTQQRDLISTITAVTAVDATTVRMTTKDPDPLFLARITYPLIVPKGQAEVAGFPDQGLDGTGPYKFVRHTPNVEIVIEKRTDYWGGDISQAPQQFAYKVVPDEAASL